MKGQVPARVRLVCPVGLRKKGKETRGTLKENGGLEPNWWMKKKRKRVRGERKGREG